MHDLFVAHLIDLAHPPVWPPKMCHGCLQCTLISSGCGLAHSGHTNVYTVYCINLYNCKYFNLPETVASVITIPSNSSSAPTSFCPLEDTHLLQQQLCLSQATWKLLLWPSFHATDSFLPSWDTATPEAAERLL